jgi:hypothetical protein
VQLFVLCCVQGRNLWPAAFVLRWMPWLQPAGFGPAAKDAPASPQAAASPKADADRKGGAPRDAAGGDSQKAEALGGGESQQGGGGRGGLATAALGGLASAAGGTGQKLREAMVLDLPSFVHLPEVGATVLGLP